MEYRMLGQTGMEVSVLGFGASSLGGVFHEIDVQEGIRATRLALEMGINYIDVSPYYGLTKAEKVLGKALTGIPRDSYYLSTKVGRYGDDPDWHPASQEIQDACRSAARYCADQGVDLAKRAIRFSTGHPEVPTTLVSTANPEHIEKNIRWLEEPVNTEVLRKVEEILEPVKNKAWLSGRPENN